MNRKMLRMFLLVCLTIGLLAIALTGCARILHKEFRVVNGKVVMVSETEYDRAGPQRLSGVEASKFTPDGTQLMIKFESQEADVDVVGAIVALGDLVAKIEGGGIITALELQSIQNQLAQAVKPAEPNSINTQ